MRTFSIEAIATWSEAPRLDPTRKESQRPLDVSLLDRRAARRASRLTRIGAHLVRELDVDLATTPLVIGSHHGPADVALELLRIEVEHQRSSPIRFQNLQGAVVGHLTIATAARGFATTISAGAATVAMTMLEAASLLAYAPRALAVLLEIPVPGPLTLPASYGALGAAFVLRRGGPREIARVRRPPPLAPLPDAIRANPCAPALALARALRTDTPVVRLEHDSTGGRPPGAGAHAWCLVDAHARALRRDRPELSTPPADRRPLVTPAR